MMRGIRWALWGLVAIGILVLGFLLSPNVRHEPIPVASGPPVAAIGGPFTLTGTDGKPFSSHRLAAKPFVIFFGFTHCPDVCPTTLARFARLRRALGKGDDAFAILFVTVDPERDTPAELGSYVAMFDAPIIPLTGSPSAIEKVKRDFGVYSAKVAQAGTDYSVDHTATVFLIDRAGKFAATIAPDEGDAAAIAKLRQLAS